MKFYGGVLSSTRKNWLNFGGDLGIVRWVNEQKTTIIVVAYPDRGAGNDPEPFFYLFFFRGGSLLQPRLDIFTVGNMRVMICLGQGGLRSLSASSSYFCYHGFLDSFCKHRPISKPFCKIIFFIISFDRIKPFSMMILVSRAMFLWSRIWMVPFIFTSDLDLSRLWPL